MWLFFFVYKAFGSNCERWNVSFLSTQAWQPIGNGAIWRIEDGKHWKIILLEKFKIYEVDEKGSVQSKAWLLKKRLIVAIETRCKNIKISRSSAYIN